MTDLRDFNKSFSDGFQQDIAELLETCVNNKTDGLTITLEYNKYDLDIDLRFRIYPHGEVSE